MNLTPCETLHLMDVISLHAYLPSGVGTDMNPPFPGMVLKLMEALVNNDEPFKDTNFTLDELFLIYEHVKSSTLIGEEKVGLNLLTKTSKEILELQKTTVDERIWGFEVTLNNDHTESNQSDTEDRASDGADTQVPA